MNTNEKAVPILIAGLWPRISSKPNSGSSVTVLSKDERTPLLIGHANEDGEFQGELPNDLIGTSVEIRSTEPGFLPLNYNNVKVENWGVMLAIQLTKDHVYNGKSGAKHDDASRWDAWNATAEHAKATERVNAAQMNASHASNVHALKADNVEAAAEVSTPTLTVNESTGITNPYAEKPGYVTSGAFVVANSDATIKTFQEAEQELRNLLRSLKGQNDVEAAQLELKMVVASLSGIVSMLQDSVLHLGLASDSRNILEKLKDDPVIGHIAMGLIQVVAKLLLG